MRIQKLAYIVCSLFFLLPGIVNAERGRPEEHRSQRGIERNHHRNQEHVAHRHRSEAHRPAHVDVRTRNHGKYIHNGKHYKYHHRGRYYNHYHQGNYYNYFYKGAYYNYFYNGRYYKSCVKTPGSSVMVCR